jgi:hypothetical protein
MSESRAFLARFLVQTHNADAHPSSDALVAALPLCASVPLWLILFVPVVLGIARAHMFQPFSPWGNEQMEPINLGRRSRCSLLPGWNESRAYGAARFPQAKRFLPVRSRSTTPALQDSSLPFLAGPVPLCAHFDDKVYLKVEDKVFDVVTGNSSPAFAQML